ncbi:MAG: hypothetical protein Q7T16_04390, partial [Candidatus Burarchaeum sp.]
MPIDLAGAKKIGFKWAVWNYEKSEWASVSIDKPAASQAPSDAIFSIDVAVEMQQKGIIPSRRGAQPQRPPAGAQAPPQAPQPAPQQYQQAAPSPYMPQLPGQPPAVVRADSQSFFSLPSAEKLAEEQQRIMQQQAAMPQRMAAAPVMRRQELPKIRATTTDMITPAVAGGIAMGVIMGIPVLNVCAPVWLLGGVLATFLLLAGAPVKSNLTTQDAAKIGALAGLVGSLVSLVVSFIAIVFIGDAVIGVAGAKE